MKRKTVSALVAAYNEEKNIAKVLSELVKYPDFQEIVVVDDGSQDNTFEEIEKFTVKGIKLEKNQGKSEAVKKGLEEMKEVDVVFLCDADLLGFKVEHAAAIIEPVVLGERDMQIGFRSKFSPVVDEMLSKIRTQWISGERAINYDLLKAASEDKRFKGYMMETVINAYVKRLGKKAGTMRLGYRNPYKTEKDGFLAGLKTYAPFAIAMLAVFFLMNYFLPKSKFRRKFQKSQ